MAWSAPPAGLAPKLDRVLQDAGKLSGMWGVAVVDMDTGESWYARDAEKSLNLASNAKIITTAAALAEFGPDHILETHVHGALDENGVVSGHLYVVGGADPRLVDENLQELVKKVQEAGVRKVIGGLRIDLRLFDDKRVPPAFDQKKTDDAYRPNIESLGVHYNAIGVGFRAGANIGAPPRVWTTPPTAYVRIVNQARTVQGKKEALVIRTEEDGNRMRLRVTGTIGVGNKGGAVRRRVVHPGFYAAHVLLRLLKKASIAFGEKGVAHGEPTEGASRILSFGTASVASHVTETNLRSNNMMAETLFKALNARRGGPGATWEGARKVVVRLLEAAGISDGSYSFVNGSGLYSADFLSPRQMTQFLRWVSLQSQWGKHLVDSLPVSGKSGTLRGRMRGKSVAGRVRAKTGTLNDVSTLSGYIETASGNHLVFSFLFNEVKGSTQPVRRIQDRLCEILVTF